MKKSIMGVIVVTLAVSLFGIVIQARLVPGTGYRRLRRRKPYKLQRMLRRTVQKSMPSKKPTISIVKQTPVAKMQSKFDHVKGPLAKQLALIKVKQEQLTAKKPTISNVPKDIIARRRGLFGIIGGGIQKGVSSVKDYVFKLRFVKSELLKVGFSEGSSKLLTAAIMAVAGTIPGVSFVSIIPKVAGVLFKLWTIEGGWSSRLGYLGKGAHKQIVATAFMEAGFPLISNTLAGYAVGKGYSAIGGAWQAIRGLGRRKKDQVETRELKNVAVPVFR